MIRSTWMFSVALVLASCAGGSGNSLDPNESLNVDIRIDFADPVNDPESTETRMCVTSDQRIYVVWLDNRQGPQDIWMTRSLDNGREWLDPPVKVKQGPGNAFAPSIACTDDRVYVAWEDDRDGELEYKNIYFQASGDDGQSWMSEDFNVDLDPDGITISQGPQVAAHEGRVYVSWSDNVWGAPDILVAASGNQGVSFSEPLRVDATSEPGVAYSAKPVMTVDSTNGNVHIVWEDSRDGFIDLYYAYSSDGGETWSDDVRIDTGDEEGENSSFGPIIAAMDGNVYAAWHDDRNGVGRDIFLNYSGDGGTSWLTESSRVDSDNEGFFDSLFPDLFLENDVAHIVWHDARQVGFDIFYRTAVAGVMSEKEVRLDTDQAGFGNSLNPQIVVTEENAVVGWMDYRDDSGEEYNDLRYNWLLDGEWSGEDLRVDSVVAGTSYAVDVSWEVIWNSEAVEGDGGYEVIAAWTDGRNGTADVFFSHVEVGLPADEALELEE